MEKLTKSSTSTQKKEKKKEKEKKASDDANAEMVMSGDEGMGDADLTSPRVQAERLFKLMIISGVRSTRGFV